MIALPRIELSLNGRPLAGEAAGRLGALRVQQRLSLPTLCELTFYDAGEAVSAMGPGAALRIGIEGGLEPLFVGEVTAVDHVCGPDGGRQLLVRGYDLLHRLRKRQPVATHIQVTLAELTRNLVRDLGLQVEAGADSTLHPQLVQYRQSDLALIADVAARAGLYFSLRDEILHILSLEGIGEPLPLRLGASLLEARVGVNGDAVCRRVETRGWDPGHAECRDGGAASPRVGRRVEVAVDPDSLGGSGLRTQVGVAVPSDDQAEARAQAELDRRVASEVTLWGLAQGDPRLRPGASVMLAGVAPSLDGRYVLTAVTHCLDRRQGFVSEIDTAPPPPPPPPPDSSLALGVVTRVEDPEGLGRVRVMLPDFDGIETGWLAVVVPGAGPGKGLIVLPDVDDRVLVLFANGEPAQGLVLGGLYGCEAPPDDGVEAGAVQRYTLVTPGGQRIQLDDGRDSLRLENSGGDFVRLTPDAVLLGDSRGSRVELTPDRCRIHAAARLEIEAPGQAIVIRGRSIDFEGA